MQFFMSVFIGLICFVGVNAAPLIEGRVRLDSGEPVADAQVRIFDMSDLRPGAIARATTDGTGYFALPLAALGGSALPQRFALGQNYPNPFNPSTIIPYQLAAAAPVRLEVFNLLGQRIATLVDGERPAGFHTATWRAVDGAGRAVGAGVYIYRMTVVAESQTGRMVLLDGQAGVSASGTASVMTDVSGVGEPAEGVYGLIVSGEGLVPYADPAFRVESGMAPVELVVQAGQHLAGKATDDDCAFCGLFGAALIVSASVSDNTPTPGQTFILRARVQNQGTDEFKNLVLSYYRSQDAMISMQDMLLGTDEVGSLAASSTSGDELIILTASSTSGTYYYGACVASVSDEGDTPYSCSPGVRVIVADGSESVSIPDANLRAAIAEALGKASGATITVAEMRALTGLDAEELGIRDLTGLEFATNLTTLDLRFNQITDVSALSGLTNLTTLDLSFNQITDVSALSGLTNLRWLYLYINQITDISALSGLTNLRWLGLSDNQITDVSPLAGLTNLTNLYLEDNQITDISALLGLTNLEKLDLDDNLLNVSSINDYIPALQDRGVTVEFHLTGTVTDDPTPVTIPDAKLREAIEAALGKARGETITRGEMAVLGSLLASSVPEEVGISDLTGLEFATNLKELSLHYNQITDISALSGLTSLTWLGLGGNQIADISPLAGLTNLTELWLGGNQITDISALSGLTNLKRLSLDINQITDVSPLQNLTNLTDLRLRGNQITDVSPLVGLTNLTWLKLHDNLLNVSSINDYIPVLQARGVTVEFDPTPVTDDPTPVTIPDANLRAAIAAALGKAEGATITKGEMTKLTTLRTVNADISDLTGLEFATNLTELSLDITQVSDISALAGLTNLTDLWLNDSQITDISALSGLTNLTWLGLGNSPITDISPLAGLTNLTWLWLGGNQITDISALSGLTNLTWLGLNGNAISDVSPLAGLTNLTWLRLDNNLLNVSSINDYIPALQDRGVTVEFDPTPYDPTPATIPDANLREAIAEKLAERLGKASGAMITKGKMRLLTFLSPGEVGIRDLTGLEFATNLTDLSLGGNQITDISALSGLTNLTDLSLGGNQITDVSPLQNLTNLTDLRLRGNQITDISALSGLTNLTDLWLDGNQITDISPLAGLTNLTNLSLLGNPLNSSSVNDHIPLFENRGVTVYSDPLSRESPFDIELVFLADYTAHEKRAIEDAARRWMSIIREDLPDYTFTEGFSSTCGDHSYRIPAGERIDDLRIYITQDDDPDADFAGWAGTLVLREISYLPVVGCMSFNTASLGDYLATRDIALHEITHVLGFGTIWYDLGFLQNPSIFNTGADTHFNGPLAIAAFNDAGGRNYTGAKVPVENKSGDARRDDSHWRFSVFWGELMAGGGALSAITIQSLADLGYNVDVTQADPYTLGAAAKASAKIAAPATHAHGEQREPIYVVDPQGRIVRTISP